MGMARYKGLMFVALWQTAPITTAVDEDGRVRLALALGAGSYEDVSVDCSGSVLDVERHAFRTGGARLDAWPGDNVRLSVAGGHVSAGGSSREGTHYGTMLALEGSRVGFGLGLGGEPEYGQQTITLPLYLRLGDMNELHFRAELFPLTPLPGTSGTFRLGTGYNQGRRGGFAGYGGLALCHFCEGTGNVGLFGEVALPVADRFDVELRVLGATGEDGPNWGAGAGGRFTLGGSRPHAIRASPAP